uniref:Lysozyme n=1 Tax=Pectinophora gossypiella TaxID=13191 RepID=A0A1E1WP73_PECGO
MKTDVLLLYMCVFVCGLCECKTFTRCSLATELIKTKLIEKTFLGNWVCLIEKESNRDTKAYIETASGKKYYGLYQIPNRWCREGKKGGDCNIKCELLLDDDIRDDTECAVNIFHKEGFKYWPKWTTRCKNDNFITTEIYKCPDLSTRSEDLLRSESLRRRRKQARVGMKLVTSPKTYFVDHVLRGQAIAAS